MAKRGMSESDIGEIGMVRVHFLVDVLLDGQRYRCDEYAEIDRKYKGMIDNVSIEEDHR